MSDESKFMIAVDKPKRPAEFGFSPSSSADVNVAALQAALDRGGIVTVETPGVYDLDNTVILNSNTRLICAPGVYSERLPHTVMC